MEDHPKMIRNKVQYLFLIALICTAMTWPLMGQDRTTQPQTPNQPQTQPQTQPSQAQPGHTQTSAQLNAQEKQFLNKAAMDNMQEIQAGKMAQQKSTNDQVRQLGQDLENDHTTAQDQLKTLAQKYNYNIPQKLDPAHQQSLDKLSGLSGNQFDREFVAAQVRDHQKAVKEFQDMSQRAQNPDVRQYASDNLTVLQKHLNEAQTAQKSLGRTSSTAPSGTSTTESSQTTTTQQQSMSQTGERQHAMPATASSEPILALIGILSLAGAAAGLRFGRNRA
jgi:predicted outer membrane protein